MTAAIPTYPPREIYAGDTLKFQKQLNNYSIEDGWTLTYEFLTSSEDLGSFSSTSYQGNHLITVAATTTSGWNAAEVFYVGRVSKSGEIYTVDRGSFTVKENFTTALNLDGRSHAKKVLDAIEAVIENRASQDQMSYSIAGRSLSRMSPEQLFLMRDRYQAEHNKEQAEIARAQGRKTKETIKVRFS